MKNLIIFGLLTIATSCFGQLKPNYYTTNANPSLSPTAQALLDSKMDKTNGSAYAPRFYGPITNKTDGDLNIKYYNDSGTAQRKKWLELYGGQNLESYALSDDELTRARWMQVARTGAVPSVALITFDAPIRGNGFPLTNLNIANIAGVASNNVWATIPGGGHLVSSNGVQVLSFDAEFKINTNYFVLGLPTVAAPVYFQGTVRGLQITDGTGVTNVEANAFNANSSTNAVGSFFGISGNPALVGRISMTSTGMVVGNAVLAATNLTARDFYGNSLTAAAVTNAGNFLVIGLNPSILGASLFNTTTGLVSGNVVGARTNFATAGLSIGGNLIANVDNSFDIGASGANRPRNYFGAGNGTFAGTVEAASTFQVAGATMIFTTGGSLSAILRQGTGQGFTLGSTTPMGFSDNANPNIGTRRAHFTWLSGQSMALGTATIGDTTGSLSLSNATLTKLTVPSGSNTRAGNATLVGGTVTVNNNTVTANTVVMLTRKTSGGTIGTAITYTLSAATSFTINSDNILDTSTFSYFLIENP